MQPSRQFHIPIKPLGKPSQGTWRDLVYSSNCGERYLALFFLLVFALSQGFHILHGLSHFDDTRLTALHGIQAENSAHASIHDNEDTAYLLHQDCLLCCHHSSPVAFGSLFSKNETLPVKWLEVDPQSIRNNTVQITEKPLLGSQGLRGPPSIVA